MLRLLSGGAGGAKGLTEGLGDTFDDVELEEDTVEETLADEGLLDEVLVTDDFVDIDLDVGFPEDLPFGKGGNGSPAVAFGRGLVDPLGLLVISSYKSQILHAGICNSKYFSLIYHETSVSVVFSTQYRRESLPSLGSNLTTGQESLRGSPS